MFEEIKNNKWTIFTVVLIFLIVEAQLLSLSSKVADRGLIQNTRKSPANSSSISQAPPQNTPVQSMTGPVKRIEGSAVVFGRYNTEFRAGITSSTKFYKTILQKDKSVSPSDSVEEISLSDIKVGDLIAAMASENIRGKNNFAAEKIVVLQPANP